MIITPERQESKEGAEKVFSFGDPGDGFDMGGMEGEGGGDKGCQEGGKSETPEQQEKQDGVGQVQG